MVVAASQALWIWGLIPTLKSCPTTLSGTFGKTVLSISYPRNFQAWPVTTLLREKVYFLKFLIFVIMGTVIELYLEQIKNLECLGAHAIFLMMWNEEEFYILLLYKEPIWTLLSDIWHSHNSTLMGKFENVQKKCLKWVLCEEEMSYNNKDVYIRKCKQVNVLPMSKRFVLNDITPFHKIVKLSD